MKDLRERIASLTPEQRAKLALSLEARRGASPDDVHRRETGMLPVLSFAQQQLWFLEQLLPGNTPYNVPIYLRFRGDLSVEALKRALDTIVQRHEVLRTCIITTAQGEPKAALAENCSVQLKQHDLRSLPGPVREQEVHRQLKTEASRPFDFSHDLMLRTMLIQLADEEYIFFHNSHHIAWDLGSKAVFYRELEVLYEAYRSGRPSPLPELAIQYSDYALWQREWLRGKVLDNLLGYWREQLAGAQTKLELPADRPRPRVQTLRGAKLPITLSKPILDAAKALSAQSGVTLFMTLLSAFAVFLYSYTGQVDMLIGSPVDGRDRSETRDLIGFFINTVVLRMRLAGQLTFRELLRAARDTILAALEHSQVPFQKVVEVTRPPRDLSRSPLFQANFRLQPGPPTTLRLAGLTVEGPYVVDNAAAKFDLSVELPSVEGASGFWEYSADLFEDKTVVRMAGEFDRLLAVLVSEPDLPLGRHEFPIGGAGAHTN